MKAAYYAVYGDPEVITIRDLPKPQPKDNEICIKIIATAVTIADSRIRAARFPKGFSVLAKAVYGLRKPRKHVLGSVFSGIVEQVGSKVTEFKVGDEICGTTGVRMGTHAEFAVVKASASVTKKPATLTHEEVAAMLFGGTAALSYVKNKLHVDRGEKVVINGASGAVGSNAVQLAKYLGADVTGVTSADNATLVRSLGATEIIDYTKENLIDSSEKYDVLLDTVGNIRLKDGLRLLSGTGRLGLMVASLGEILKASFIPKVKAGVATEKKEEIEYLLSLMEKKQLRAIIDKTYSLSEIVKAYEHVDSGKKKGNVIVRI